MAYTAPTTVVANTTPVSASLWNTDVRDNLNHLYNNLQRRCGMWHYEAEVLTGNAITKGTSGGSQYHNIIAYQNASANADSFQQSFVLAAGDYTLKILGRKRTNGGKLDWTIDGVSIATGQDWYNGTNTDNDIQTISVTIAEGGRHVLKGTVNGKNASSSGYDIQLTRYWFEPDTDS